MNTLEKKISAPRWRQIVSDGLAAVGYWRAEEIAAWIVSDADRLRAFRRSAAVGRPSRQANFEFATERTQLLAALDRIAPRAVSRAVFWQRSRRRVREILRMVKKLFR